MAKHRYTVTIEIEIDAPDVAAANTAARFYVSELSESDDVCNPFSKVKPRSIGLANMIDTDDIAAGTATRAAKKAAPRTAPPKPPVTARTTGKRSGRKAT